MAHFYDRAGIPRHTVFMASGKERPSTTRDARKHGWLASVSTIQSIASEQSLIDYQVEQAIDAAWVHPYTCGADVKEWKQKIRRYAKQHRENASKDGQRIHRHLENYFKGDWGLECNASDLDVDIVTQAASYLWEMFGNEQWIAEETFALDFGGGFGGCVDLHTKDGRGIVIDYKTQATGNVKNFKYYKKYCQQLAAYRVGLGLNNAECYSFKISTTHPGVFQLKKWPEDELKRQFNGFYHLLKYYNIANRLTNE